jgi:hypothetical protein
MENAEEDRGYGNIPVEKGLIARDQPEQAFTFRQARGGKLKDILVERGYATKDEKREFVNAYLDTPYLKLSLDIVDPDAAKLIPAKVAREHMSLTVIGDILTIAVSNPLNTVSIDMLAFASGYSLEAIMSDEGGILAAIDFISSGEALSNTRAGLQDEAVEFMDRFDDAEEKVKVDKAPARAMGVVCAWHSIKTSG